MTTPHDEPTRDAWLREALRHAPDADAAPPAALSDNILRQARNAVKVAARPAAATSHPLLQLWSWLARPPVAAGFATVMVATLVGVMWWDQPLDRTLPPSEPPVAAADHAAAPAPVQAPVVTPLAPAAAPPRPPDAATTTRAEKAAPRAPATRAAPPPPQAAPAQERERRSAAATEPAPAEAAGALRAGGADSTPPPPLTAAAPAAVPSPAPAPTPAAADTAAKRAFAEARDEAATQRSAPAAAVQSLAKAAPPTATPTIDQPERWTWQRDDGRAQAMTPALQRWLSQLDRAARWRPATTAPTAADGPALQLWRDGALRATLHVGENTAWLARTDGPLLAAPLSPEVAAALRAGLIAATP